MSEAKIQMALRYVRIGEDLVADQRCRVGFWMGRGEPGGLASARQLLSILEDSLEMHRRDLERLRQYYQAENRDASTSGR